MFDFLSRGRSKPPTTAEHPRPTHAAPVPPPSAAQREMVRLALHSVLRNKGIPGNWLTCEIIPVQIPGQGEAVLVQLVVLKWHEALMRYAPALQVGMIDGLKHFDANASATKYHFSWTFAPDCGYPHSQFPEPSFWSTSVAPAPIGSSLPIGGAVSAAAVVAAASTPSKPKFDLPPTAADLRNSNDEDDDHGFAATQINDM